METFAHILPFLPAPLIGIAMLFTAKKTNAQWRAKRDARRAAATAASAAAIVTAMNAEGARS